MGSSTYRKLFQLNYVTNSHIDHIWHGLCPQCLVCSLSGPHCLPTRQNCCLFTVYGSLYLGLWFQKLVCQFFQLHFECHLLALHQDIETDMFLLFYKLHPKRNCDIVLLLGHKNRSRNPREAFWQPRSLVRILELKTGILEFKNFSQHCLGESLGELGHPNSHHSNGHTNQDHQCTKFVLTKIISFGLGNLKKDCLCLSSLAWQSSFIQPVGYLPLSQHLLNWNLQLYPPFYSISHKSKTTTSSIPFHMPESSGGSPLPSPIPGGPQEVTSDSSDQCNKQSHHNHHQDTMSTCFQGACDNLEDHVYDSSTSRLSNELFTHTTRAIDKYVA